MEAQENQTTQEASPVVEKPKSRPAKGGQRGQKGGDGSFTEQRAMRQTKQHAASGERVKLASTASRQKQSKRNLPNEAQLWEEKYI